MSKTNEQNPLGGWFELESWTKPSTPYVDYHERVIQPIRPRLLL